MKPVIISVFDSEQRTTTDYTFTKSPIRIGRNPLNDLTLPFPFVSGWHAVVRFDENLPRFYDLGSTNGTLYEGRRIQPGEPLDVGELLSVTIGRLELRLRRGEVDVATGTLPMSAPPQRTAGPVAPTAITPAQVPPPGDNAIRGLEVPMPGTQAPSAPYQPTGPYQRVPSSPPSTQPSSPASTPSSPPSMPPSIPPAPPSMPPPVHDGTRTGTIDPAQMPGPSGDDGTAHVQMGAVHEAISRARPRYDALRQAAESLVAELSSVLPTMPQPLQQLAVPMLAREYPELAKLPQFAELAARVGARVPDAPAAGGSVASVRRLSDKVRPEEPPPASPEEAERFLDCVSDVLLAAAGALIELQKGQEQFGNEMGVRVIKEFTPLHAAGTPENLLRYLLDWNKGGPHRTQELRGVYADLMIHQVALIRGVVEGARAMIARLDPRDIERGLASAWPSKSAAAWKAYEKLWHELSSEDRKITEVVFGPEFARAYAEVGGES